ncbi:discoidin domain-containing protein [Luteolibacter ambystomatis]|uniref:Discoidin domain-containing protein n=1 Tax=Luteolibacter ambystomatis TaxID=2824561 RepID=A0A975G541_9BACT|nr:discoidin domain-containing protein [Luteolibacter ambystomatis]QUE49482.1 discoidin domain-containing protein [Luteolibacter ambystomatis]
MSAPFHDRRLEALTHLLLDGDLPPDAAEELAGLLRGSSEARRHYRRIIAIHSSLVRHGRDEVPTFAPEIVPMPVRRRGLWWPVAAAAAVGLMVGTVIFSSRRPDPAPATLSGMTAASWPEPVALQQGFGPGRVQDLAGGFAELSYRSGVKVVLEAPCRFEVTGDHSMKVTRGRASVKVPKGTSGFYVDTPGGRITDLGTEFGVAVGRGDDGAVVVSEVFDGEIQIPGAASSFQRLKRGESMAILRDSGGTRLLSQLDNQPVSIANPARQLPAARPRPADGVNLALGKPVFSPNYYAGRTGEVFPPDKLTDGRLNDTGVPGDWSFWLAPNQVDGEFTVDLLEPATIARVDLQNTRNRNHADRGTRAFSLLVSDDNVSFREVARGELAQITELPPPGTDIPFESFRFAPVTARYVKLVCLSHWRNASRPVSNPNEGGGLNEIRIFAP